MTATEYNQASFAGGMNYLLDDTHLANNQYRLGFNIRNRYGVLDSVKGSVEDPAIPNGINQEVITFGEYIVMFVSGFAWYRRYSDTGWTKIDNFAMSTTAPRYWTVAVPVATTSYGRLAGHTDDISNVPTGDASIKSLNVNNVASSFNGNLPGLLVQDNVNQPTFIFLDSNNVPTCRVTQTYDEWEAPSGWTGALADKREYVPIGNVMAWSDGNLYIASQDGNSIYRSVSGRPLDFVVNVTPEGDKGGDATTTAYSVGVGGISCLRAMQDGSLFVAASNSNFLVQKNMSQNATLLWGEYTFIRRYLFESTCVNDRCIIDSLGDTRFIDINGVRSFNSVEQTQNEGRNTPFTATISRAFQGILQDVAAAILYDNYELYAVTTIFGPAIAVYDTISNCWTAFDTEQCDGKKIKQFVKIELGVQRLYAVTEDNKFYNLYVSDDYVESTVVTAGISPNTLDDDYGHSLMSPKYEVKLSFAQFIYTKITRDVVTKLTAVVDDRVSAKVNQLTKTIKYKAPVVTWSGVNIPEIGNQLQNVPYTVPDTEQGWKVAFILSWTGGASVTQFTAGLKLDTPVNPLNSQGGTVI